MAFSSTEKKEIESLIRKEIKSFFKADTVKQFENNLIDVLSKEVKKGKLRGDINDVVIDLTTEFYYQLWSRKNQWQSALKNKK
jgi:hypothetical protein